MILAGDIHHMADAVQYAGAVQRYLDCPVIAVPGNHEYYGADLTSALETGWKLAWTHEQMHLLDRGRSDFVVRGRTIAVLGATLWTNFELQGRDLETRARAIAIAQHCLSDFAEIRYEGRRFRAADSLTLHHQAYDWLRFEARQARETADIVVIVTHHAPIPDAIPPQHRGSDLSPAFASDLRAEIESWRPDLWVWGHTHHSMDTQLGGTRLVSAQRGYLGGDEMTQAEIFEPAIVEIGR
jgi:predicted phosphodiesterase